MLFVNNRSIILSWGRVTILLNGVRGGSEVFKLSEGRATTSWPTLFLSLVAPPSPLNDNRPAYVYGAPLKWITGVSTIATFYGRDHVSFNQCLLVTMTWLLDLKWTELRTNDWTIGAWWNHLIKQQRRINARPELLTLARLRTKLTSVASFSFLKLFRVKTFQTDAWNCWLEFF